MHSIGWRALLFLILVGSACAPIAPSPSKYVVTPSGPLFPGGEPSGSQSSLQTILEFMDEGTTSEPQGSRVFSWSELNTWITSGGVQIEAVGTAPARIVLTLGTRQGLGDVANFRVEAIHLGADSWWFGVEGGTQEELWEVIAPRLLTARLEW